MLNIYESILRRILAESRVSDVKEKYPQIADKIDRITASLPEKLHRLIPWAAKQLSVDNDIDLSVMIDTLKTFDDNIQRIKSKDIDTYKTFDDLRDTVKNIESIPTKSQKQEKIKSDADKIYESDKFTVIVPKSVEASCKYGANTKWCISGEKDNKFKEYNDFVITAIIINNDKQHDDEFTKKIAYVMVPDNEGVVKKVQIFNAIDKEMSEDDLRQVLGVEFTKIKQKMSEYAKNSDVGRMSEEKAWKLATSKDPDERQIAAQSEYVPQEVLEFLADDKDKDVRYALAGNEKLKSRNIFATLSVDEEDGIRSVIALDRNIPTDIVNRMIHDEYEPVRQHALSNPRIDVNILRKLHKSFLEKTQWAIARNTSSPKDVLDHLANSRFVDVREQVANNPNTDIETLKRLTKDEAVDRV